MDHDSDVSKPSLQNEEFNRRRFLQGLAGGATAFLTTTTQGSTREARESSRPKNTFKQRGYYFTFCRMPTVGLDEWKQILRLMKADGCNFLILWVGGAFRSKKFPITWQYNREHRNIQHDFVRELIDFAHSMGIRTVLGFTPFAYDGVNQYTLEHPELKAYQKNGNLAPLAGMDCWGYALNPSKREAQQFMLEYASEMYFDFYPNADGLFIESSDYTICWCPYCKGHYYEKEFEFVKAISERVWQKRPNATIVVYPHYFSGAEIPHFGRAAKEEFDQRWTLFFTPHSAPLQKDVVQLARNSIYWDAMVLQTPSEVRQSAQKARDFGTTGYVVSAESYSYIARYPEGGNWNLVGRKMNPFGYLWVDGLTDLYEYLLTRVLRVAYREFSRDVDLPFDDFRERLKAEVFAPSTPLSAVDDLLDLQKAYATDRTWFTAGPAVSPEILKWQLELGRVKPAQLENYRLMLDRLRKIRRKYSGTSTDPGVREMVRVIDWIDKRWMGEDAILRPPYVGLRG